jgi:hypothetical protein
MNPRGVGVVVAVASVAAFAVLYGLPGPQAVPLAVLAGFMVYALSKDAPTPKPA